jgi:uncharacterized membrane protein
MKRLIATVIIVLAVVVWNETAWSTADFSAQTGLSCNYCHENPDGGGTLTPEGDAFRAAGYVLPDQARPSLWPRIGRLLLGFIHVLAAFIWLGTIFYVHLFMGPRSLTSGLPKSEVLLGRLAMLAVGLSGLGLTWLRLRSLDELWTTTFGLVLLVKVGLFSIMILVAVLATVVIDRKLRKTINDRPGDRAGTAGRLQRWSGPHRGPGPGLRRLGLQDVEERGSHGPPPGRAGSWRGLGRCAPRPRGSGEA